MRVALPTGRLADPAWIWLERHGFPRSGTYGRRLWIRLKELDVVTVRGRDIPDLVVQRVVDAAIVGWDVVEESGLPLWSSGSLGFGACRLMLAVPEDTRMQGRRLQRIATRYPKVTRRWLSSRRMDAEVLTLGGAIEAAPWLGLADAIVDVVETGATLRANGLTPVETVLPSYATLVTCRGLDEYAAALMGRGGEDRHAVGKA